MLVSGALSRAYIKNSKPELDENGLTNLPISNECLERFKEEIQKRSNFTSPCKVHYWRLAKKTFISHQLQPYFIHISPMALSYHEVPKSPTLKDSK